MALILVALFIVIPVVEIAMIIQVGSVLGVVPTVALLFGMAIAGGLLAKHQGLRALQEVRTALVTGRGIGVQVTSAALVLVAAVLMLAPGFVSDAVGIVLLIPPVRNVIARRISRYLGAHAQAQATRSRPPDIIDI